MTLSQWMFHRVGRKLRKPTLVLALCVILGFIGVTFSMEIGFSPSCCRILLHRKWMRFNFRMSWSRRKNRSTDSSLCFLPHSDRGGFIWVGPLWIQHKFATVPFHIPNINWSWHYLKARLGSLVAFCAIGRCSLEFRWQGRQRSWFKGWSWRLSRLGYFQTILQSII